MVKLRKGTIAWYKNELRKIRNSWANDRIDHNNQLKKIEKSNVIDAKHKQKMFDNVKNENAVIKSNISEANNVIKMLKINMLHMEKKLSKQGGIIQSLDKHGKYKKEYDTYDKVNYDCNMFNSFDEEKSWVNY